MKVVALRHRPAGGDVKSPHAALAEDLVVSDEEKAQVMRQVGIGKTSVSEPLSRCTPMTRSCTVLPSVKLGRCVRHSLSGWKALGCNCIPRKPELCTARTISDALTMSTCRLLSWGTH